MKILVTGSAGFIGMHVAQRLLARGDQVVGIDNLNDYYDVSLKQARLRQLEGRPGFRFVKMDLADQTGISALFHELRPEQVDHLAAQAGNSGTGIRGTDGMIDCIILPSSSSDI